MKSADELESGKSVKSEGRGSVPVAHLQGEAAGVVSLQSEGLAVPSIANLTSLIAGAIPLTVLPNGLALSTPLVVPQSTIQNANPSILDFKGQVPQLLSNELGLRLVTDPNFKSPVVIGLPAAATASLPIKRETTIDDDFSDTDDESSSNQEWASPGGGAMHSDESAVDYSVNAPSYNSSSGGTKGAAKKMRTSTGSRRSNKDLKLTPEEEERRKLRRERNKLAAAKCRQKRVDQTNQLLAETQVLEEEQSRLEEEIKKYQQQKEELEFVLEAHRLHCVLGKQPALGPPAPAVPHVPVPSDGVPAAKPDGPVEEATSNAKAQPAHGAAARVVAPMQRPTSFPMVSRSLLPGLSSVSQALGIPISTPSSGIVITLGLDSMLDGHTGLTPITGVPSIVAQTPQNPPSDVVPSSGDALAPASSSASSAALMPL